MKYSPLPVAVLFPPFFLLLFFSFFRRIVRAFEIYARTRERTGVSVLDIVSRSHKAIRRNFRQKIVDVCSIFIRNFRDISFPSLSHSLSFSLSVSRSFVTSCLAS